MVSREGDEAKILAYQLSRLNGEHRLWVGYTTNVVTESDLWMSALLSHSGCSFKVFPQHCICKAQCNDAVRVIFGKAWWQHRILWGFFFFTIFNSCSPLSVLLVVYVYHTPAHGCYVKFLVVHCRIVSVICISSSISCFCLFHTWVAFIFSFLYLPLTQTHTLTQHTAEYAHKRIS